MESKSSSNSTLTYRLRPFIQDDIPSIVPLCNDLILAKRLARLPHPYTEDSAKYFLNVVCKSENEQVWAIEIITKTDVKTNVTLIGAISLSSSRVESPSTDTTASYEGIQDLVLGIWIGRKFWRNGHATKSLEILLSHVFNNSHSVEYSIVAEVFDDNVASMSLLKNKFGFKRTGGKEATSMARPNEKNIPTSILRLNRFQYWKEITNVERKVEIFTTGSCTTYMLFFSAFFVLVSSLLLIRVSNVLHQTHPSIGYMDEIFHIPQTQKYCNYLLSSGTTLKKSIFNIFWDVPYDNKITTPPGLYIMTSYILQKMNVKACTPLILRSINIIFQCGTMIVIYNILILCLVFNKRNIHRHSNQLTIFLNTIMLISSPVHFFFGFLYYTDSSSTFFTLLSYYLTLHVIAIKKNKRYIKNKTLFDHLSILLYNSIQFVLTVIVGLCALACRQNNVIWSAFCIGTLLVDHLHSPEMIVSERSRKFPSILPMNVPPSPITEFYSLISFLKSPNQILSFVCDSTLLGHFTVILIFTYCYVHNDYNIVLGDQSNHLPMLHTSQLLYFMMYVSTIFSIQWVDRSYKGNGICGVLCHLIETTRKSMIMLTLLVAGILFTVISVQYYSPTHPFMLADNRHYIFYIWKNIFNRHRAIKYLFIPLYVIFSWGNIRRLRLNNSLLWCIGLVICTSLVLVPAHLVEFRYFTVPCFLWQIHMLTADSFTTSSNIYRIVTIILHVTINSVVMWVFLYRTFQAPDGSIGRFMY
jgi:alpha-1,2-glucosyltransferase